MNHAEFWDEVRAMRKDMPAPRVVMMHNDTAAEIWTEQERAEMLADGRMQIVEGTRSVALPHPDTPPLTARLITAVHDAGQEMEDAIRALPPAAGSLSLQVGELLPYRAPDVRRRRLSRVAAPCGCQYPTRQPGSPLCAVCGRRVVSPASLPHRTGCKCRECRGV